MKTSGPSGLAKPRGPGAPWLGLDSAMAPGNKYLSEGLSRSRTDNLVVMRSAEPATEAHGQGNGQGNVTAIASHGPTARSSDAIERATALKQQAQHDLSSYIFLLLYFRTPFGIAILMAFIYVVYIAWDYFKTREYSDDFYDRSPSQPATPPLVPNGLTYLWRCVAEWVSPSPGGKLRSGAITVGWTAFFLTLAPLAAWPVATTDLGKIAFALLLICANYLYRSDKRTDGKFICSGFAKLSIVIGIVAAVATYLKDAVGLIC
jgi:hypothetical protein